MGGALRFNGELFCSSASVTSLGWKPTVAYSAYQSWIYAHVVACQTETTQHEPSNRRFYFNQKHRSRKEMPFLTPSYLPPPATTNFPSPSCATSNGTCPSAANSLGTPILPEQDPVVQRSDVPLVKKRTLKISFVELETPAIREDMAASLAVALLGHVLFLKSQVPLYAYHLLIDVA